MEHSTSAVNWQPVNYAKPPGQLMRNSLAHVARGADAVGYFQWRASRAGAEKFHSALVPHAGTDTKVWREVVELGALLQRAADVAGTRVESKVALLFDWQAGWACDQGNHPSEAVRYIDQPQALHRALWRAAITTDVVSPGADLSGYSVVVVPTLYLVDDATADEVRRFVERGGHALVTYFSGIVDPDDHIRLGGYPGAFADLLGIRTEEFFPLTPGTRVALDPAEAQWATAWSGPGRCGPSSPTWLAPRAWRPIAPARSPGSPRSPATRSVRAPPGTSVLRSTTRRSAPCSPRSAPRPTSARRLRSPRGSR